MSMCKALQELEQKGIEQGIEEGIEQGIEEGIEQGIEQGRKDERAKIILKMLKNGLDKNQIERLTGATSEEIKVATETVSKSV